ncbi:MAG: cell division protein ZapB [Candidatus Berkiella sp.]
MTTDLLQKLEQKVAHAVEVIELLRMQIEELEMENTTLKAEHEKWRKDLVSLISRFDQIEEKAPRAMNMTHEEEFMTV